MGIVLVAIGCCAGAGGLARADDPAAPSAGPSKSGDDEGITPGLPEAIDRALAKGVAWLRGRQSPEGWWGPLNNPNKTYNATKDGYQFPVGPTALAVYTLLKCGVPVTDPAIKKGFDWLRRSKRLSGSAYETSMMLLAVVATADPFKRTKDSRAAGERVRLDGDYRSWAVDLRDDLLTRRAPLAWRYYRAGSGVKGGDQDLSSTQLAVLALFAAERCGIKVDSQVWVDAMRFALAQQDKDGPRAPRAVAAKPSPASGPVTTGPAPAHPRAVEEAPDQARGFSYIKSDDLPAKEGKSTGGMTAGGIATLMMGRFVLQQRKDKPAHSLDAATIQQSIYDGLAWLDKNWSPEGNPPNAGYDTYYYYSVERAMDLVGGHRLGNHVWFAEIARPLVDVQKEDGRWSLYGLVPIYDVLDTCFALLFLHRATLGGIPFPSVTGGSDDPPTEAK